MLYLVKDGTLCRISSLLLTLQVSTNHVFSHHHPQFHNSFESGNSVYSYYTIWCNDQSMQYHHSLSRPVSNTLPNWSYFRYAARWKLYYFLSAPLTDRALDTYGHASSRRFIHEPHHLCRRCVAAIGKHIGPGYR